MTFKPAKGPRIPSDSQKVNHFHHGAGAVMPGGGMGIQIGYGGDPVPPSSESATSGGPDLYTAFKSGKPMLAVLFTDGRFGHVIRAGNLNVLEVDKAQSLELAAQLIEYAKTPDGTYLVAGMFGAGSGGAGGGGGGGSAGGGIESMRGL